jgi:hypothetical protein
VGGPRARGRGARARPRGWGDERAAASGGARRRAVFPCSRTTGKRVGDDEGLAETLTTA